MSATKCGETRAAAGRTRPGAGARLAFCAALALGLYAPGERALADPVTVETVRMWPAPDHTRVVFDVSGPLEHSVFRLSGPERVVIDLRGAKLLQTELVPMPNDNQILGVRAAMRQGSDLRIVLDLKRRVGVRSFLLKPNRKYGHRLVVDLEAQRRSRPRPPPVAEGSRLREVVVAIDPGHGGEDPGAIGSQGSREKVVVYQIAKRLMDELAAVRGIKPVLVRSGDYYLGLRKRMEVARAHRADLFISIHADAFQDRRVDGSSVYVLSRNGASSEAAKWLADQENAADLIGGVSLDDKDGLLASVLLDLSQTATLSASAEAATRVLDELDGLSKLHKRHVQRAGFAVLKSPDIPSILVETGFISNPREERRLRSADYQKRLARAMASGVQRYFERNAPEGTLLAAKRHVIARGDTLSHIATRYEVPLAVLRAENKLSDDRLRVGQVLLIPSGQGS